MERKIFGIFVAAGHGLRMGSETPKQFLELDGVPILQRTIERFTMACPGIEVVTVLPASHIATWKTLCVEHNFNIKQILVEGGITRYHSVQNALKKIPDGATVMIHDGVRPFVSESFLKRLLEESRKSRGVIPVLPTFDSLKTLEKNAEGRLMSSNAPDPDRSRIFCAQTPQVFYSEDLKEAYSQAYDLSFTDDASVARRKNIPLSFIEGERWNIKITTPDDLAIAGALLSFLP